MICCFISYHSFIYLSYYGFRLSYLGYISIVLYYIFCCFVTYVCGVLVYMSYHGFTLVS